jgi:hypothetical protein
MKRKTYWDIYLIIRNYKGKDLLKTNEVLKIFGYSKNTYINNTKAYPFIQLIAYEHPFQYWKIRNNEVAVLYKDLPDVIKKRIGSLTRNIHHTSHYFNIIDPDDKIRYFINEDQIPFWKLAKYGGYII